MRGSTARLTTPFRRWGRRLGLSSATKKDGEDDDPGEQGQPQKRRRLFRRRPVLKQVEYSQVHLTSATGTRQIVHIGAAVGYQAVELPVKGRQQPATLHFSRLYDNKEPGVNVRLISGPECIQLDGQPLERLGPPQRITTNTTLTIDRQAYTCELFAADDTPLEIGLNAVWMTNAGGIPKLNEDAIGLGQHEQGSIFVVADGVQGGYAGELVSEFAVKYLLLVFKKNVNLPFPWPEVLQRGYERINTEVRHFARRSPDHAGTTLTALIIQGWSATVAHVGDSRLYLLRQGRLRQLTQDHVVRTQAVAADPNAPEAVKYPRLSQAIGKEDAIAPDFFSFTLQPGDRLMLCTDGITDAITNELLGPFLESTPLPLVPPELVQRGNALATPDNASVIALSIQSRGGGADWQATSSDRVYAAQDVHTARLRHSTAYETVHRQTHAPRRDWRLPVALVVLLIVLAGYLRLNGWPIQSGAANLVQTATVAPVVISTDTPPPSVTAIPTQRATATAFPTARPSPTNTFAPTSTIRSPSN